MSATISICELAPPAGVVASNAVQTFESIDEAIRAYKALVREAVVASSGGACNVAREIVLAATAPFMQRAYAPSPSRTHPHSPENEVTHYAPAASVVLARARLSHGGARLASAVREHEWSRLAHAGMCDDATTSATVTWSMAPQHSCAGQSHPRTKRFESVDAAFGAVKEAAARYDDLSLTLLSCVISANLYKINEDAADFTSIIACTIASMRDVVVYERATKDTLSGLDAQDAYVRSLAMATPSMFA